MTPQQIEQFRIKAKQELGFSDAQVDGYLRAKGITPVSVNRTQPKPDFKVSDVGKGFLKGAQSTISNVGSFGQKALEGITGVKSQTPTLNQTIGDKLKPTNTAQSIGFGAEKIGEFFVPGGVGLKATKGASLAARAGTEALGTGLVASAQGGKPKDIATIAGISATIPIVGKLASIVTTPAKKILAERISPALLNKYILRPTAKEFHFGKDPGLGVAKEGLTANTREGLLTQITAKKKEIGNQIDEVLKKPEFAVKKIEVKSALAGLDKKIAKAAEEGEEVLYNRLTKIREGITGKFQMIEGKAVKVADRATQLTPLEAAQLKRKIGSASKWTGQAFDQEVNQARVEVYRALNEMIDKAVPGSKALNSRYANMLTAERALDNTINVAKRQSPIGLIDSGISSAVGLGSLASGAGSIGAIVNGLVTATGLKVLKSTAVQTRLASRLAKMTPEQQSSLVKAMPLFRNLLLGISQSETEESDQPQDQEELGL